MSEKNKMDNEMFFSNESNNNVLGAFLRKAEAAHINEETLQSRLDTAKYIISYIHKSPQEWDERCTFNIKHIGDQFLKWLREFDSTKVEQINHIYVIAYRFLCEYDFLVGPGKELSMELSSIKNKIQNDAYELDGDLKSQITYASYVMPANIAKDFINDSNIGVFRDFQETKEKAKKLKEDWDNEIEEKMGDVDNLKNNLDKYKIGFNFVGLYQGFKSLGDDKDKEIELLFKSLIAMGAFILVPLLIELIIVLYYSFFGMSLGGEHLIKLLPILSIEIILIYFFRVILFNYKSAKAQKMQIELRQTLCQFIQSYAEYSSKIKEKDKAALEKFENLIFSGVLSDADKLPSTFDGLEQIGNFIKNLKGS